MITDKSVRYNYTYICTSVSGGGGLVGWWEGGCERDYQGLLDQFLNADSGNGG